VFLHCEGVKVMLWCISYLRSSLDHTNTLLCATHSVSAQDTSDEMHDFVDIIPTLLFSLNTGCARGLDYE
jgi:hypothetical protein